MIFAARHSLLLGLLLAAAPAAAQPPVALRLTLDEAIARARAASQRLAELRAREEGAAAAVAQREAAERPVVAAHAGYTRTNHVDEFGVPTPDGRFRVIYPDIPDNYRTRVELHWPLYTGGRGAALAHAARAEREALGAETAVAEADLALETARAYWAVVTAGESVRVLEAAAARAEAHLADVRARLDAGVAAPHEVAAVEAQRARQQMLLAEARGQHLSSEAALARLLGLPLDQRFALVEPLDVPQSVATPGRASSREPGADRPERAAARLRLDAVQAREAAARVGDWPAVALLGGVDYAHPNPRIFPRRAEWVASWDLTVQASWSIWDGGRTQAELAQARAAVAAERARAAEIDAAVALDVRQRRLELDAAQAAVAAADEAVRAAAEAERVAADRFDAGLATSTEVLDAQVARLQAELDRTRARAGLRLALARLARAEGRAP